MSGRRGVRQTFAQCASKCNNISGCHAVEMWFAYNWNCYWCTKPELIRPYTNKRDLAYPVHVWTRSKCYRSLGILSKDVFIERCTSTESGLFAFLGSRPGGGGGGGLLPMMACTGRLRSKGVSFAGFRYIKG